MKTKILQNSALALVAAIVLIPSAEAALLDLTDGLKNNLPIDPAIDNGFVDSDLGGKAFVTLTSDATKPAGTGVFEPFLKLQQTQGSGTLVDSNIEQAYNTDGRIGSQAPLDGENAANWNHALRISDLRVTFLPDENGVTTGYVGFELDAHEPDTDGKNLLSIDNIRIYTKHADATPSGSGAATTESIDDGSLGTLRYALNNPNVVVFNDPEPSNWVKFDASHDYSTGSGQSDLVFYVPVAAFFTVPGLQADDYVYFYNLNGVHFAADPALAAESTPEEWRQVGSPTPVTFSNPVPDGGTTALLLGLGLFGVGMLARSRFLKEA